MRKVKMEMVTLIGKGTLNLTCFVYEINSEIFSLSRCFIFLGGGKGGMHHLDVFTWQTCFFGRSS